MTQPIAYSYLRFSDPTQARGDSRRRQTTAAARYAEDNGLTLDDSLRDEGISAFRGRHREASTALGRFLAKIEAGEVKRGSYLLIDDFSRLSREREMAAMHLFTGIIAAGVKVVTLNDGHVYTETSDVGALVKAVVEVSRSHNESAEKSRKVRDALKARRARARKAGRPWAQRWPFWLDQVESGFVILEDRADVVRRIFAMKIEGLGNAAIAQRLNAEPATPPPRQPGWRPADVSGVLTQKPGFAAVPLDAVELIRELEADGLDPAGIARHLNQEGVDPPRQPGWHTASIANLLASRSVFGEFQPHVLAEDSKSRIPDGEPLSDYYPPIITRATFEAARAVVASRTTSSARAGAKEFRNLLVGLVRCEKCGGTAGYWQATRKGQDPAKTQRVIRCNAYPTGACNNRTRLPYTQVENELLAYVGGLPMAERPTTTANHLATRRAELTDVQSAQANLLDLVAKVGASDSAAERIAVLDAQAKALQADVERLERADTIERNLPTPADWRAAMLRLIADMKNADVADRYAIRSQINHRLRQAVAGGFYLSEGHLKARFSTTDSKGGGRQPLWYGADDGLIRWELTEGMPTRDQVMAAA